MAKTKKRILKSESILSALLDLNQNFYIGLTSEEYKNNGNKGAFKLKSTLNNNDIQLPASGGAITKQNIEGKLERVQPERKHIVNKLIEYTRKSDGTFISYRRDFNIYVKELVGKYKTALQCSVSPTGELLILSPLLVFDNTQETNRLNTHIINLFLEIFGIYDIYKEDKNPAIAYHKKFDFEILPSGEFTDEDKTHILEGVARYTKNPDDIESLKERLDYIQLFKPKVVGSGSKGFQGYVVFEFKELNIALLESMHKDNATYIFNIEDYEQNIVKDKQDLIKNRLYKKRVKHTELWKDKIDKILKKQKGE